MFRWNKTRSAAVARVPLLVLTVAAVGCAPRPAARKVEPIAVKARVEPSVLRSLRWRSIGPYRGGRVVAVAGHPTDPLVFYFGGTGGGVWKTTDGGWTWKNVSDGYFRSGSVGAIAVSPSNPDVVYVGMGEGCIRGNLSPGDGVYKSIDGGKTWQQMGLRDTQHIGKIQVHPKNPDLVYVAALGHAFGANPERGVFRSKDGGKTWQTVLFKSDKAGAIDLSIDPAHPQVLYAAIWEARRYPWAMRSGGPDSGIFKTTDGGDRWVDITNNPGLPKGLKGRIGIAVSPPRPQRVWAIIEAAGRDKGVYRSDDGGATWQQASNDPNLSQRPWYYMHVFADTQDPDTVYVNNFFFLKSADGGRTFEPIPTPHSDNHDLWLDPRNPRRMIESNDGGANISFNGGESWSTVYNQATAQFYHVFTDNQFPYRVYGPQQDAGSISVPSRSDYGAIAREEWFNVGGGESGYIAVSPEDPNIVFGHNYSGRMTRYDHRTQQTTYVSVWPEYHVGWGARDLKYRFQWTFPIVFSPHNPKVLYAAANQVFRSTDLGNAWEAISPDLSRNDPSKMEPTPRWGYDPPAEYWGPISRENVSVEYYGTVFTLAESPVQRGLLWAGSDDGLIHLSMDGGGMWENITPKELPEWSLISIIEPSPHDAATAYVAATKYKFDDFRPYLYKTDDYGKTWRKITQGIPEDEYTRVIREDPARRGLLYAGTEQHVYVSFNDGESWQSLRLNLPIVPIHDLVVKDNDLVAATHGRSFWILDNLTVLREMSDEILKASVHLYKPPVTVRFRANAGRAVRQLQSWPADEGQNPPSGVIVDYHLAEKPKGEVTLTFLDGRGQAIRTFSSQAEGEGPKVSAEAGGSRFAWNMRHPGAREVPGAVFIVASLEGPLAPPGTYQVQLSVDGGSLAQSFEIVKDPRLKATQKDLEDQFALLIRVRDKISETHDAVNEIRNIRQQLLAAGKRTEGKAEAASIAQAVKSIDDKLWPIEDALIQFRAGAPRDLWNYAIRLNNKLASLNVFVESADGAPTKPMYETFDDLSRRVDEQIAALTQLVESDLASFDRRLQELKMPTVRLEYLKTIGSSPAEARR